MKGQLKLGRMKTFLKNISRPNNNVVSKKTPFLGYKTKSLKENTNIKIKRTLIFNILSQLDTV